MPKPIVANGLPGAQASRENGRPPRAVIYARVSTTDQADRGYSLPTQIDACRLLAQHQGYTVPEGYLFTDDYTGTSLNRLGLRPSGIWSSSAWLKPSLSMIWTGYRGNWRISSSSVTSLSRRALPSAS